MNLTVLSQCEAKCRLAPLEICHVDAVLSIENRAYTYPWTYGNFVDALNAGYLGRRLLDARANLLGHLVAMLGVDEVHVLNLTVAPEQQGRGHGRYMLAWLVALCQETGAGELLLEVRSSNVRARGLYAFFGLREIGLRKDYYPAPSLAHPHHREDAVVMSLLLRDAE